MLNMYLENGWVVREAQCKNDSLCMAFFLKELTCTRCDAKNV